jgi:2-hydroxy-6-oxonona-2,4-dienedioate hydrolase
VTTRNIIFLSVILIAVGAGTWTYASFQRDLAASRERLAGASKIIETKSGPIEFAEVGQGPVLLVVHGAGGGFDQGLDILGPLARRGFRLISVSRFGYLRTPLPTDASPAAQADAHANLLEALGIQRASIFGVLAGGPSAMQFAIRHPERCDAIVLMVPLAYRPSEVTASVPKLSPTTETILMTIVGSDFAYWLGSKLAPSMIFKTVMVTPTEVVAAASSEERRRMMLFMNHILPISSRVQGIMKDSAIGNSLQRYDLEAIKAPSLLVSARDDLYGTFTSTEYSAEKIPGARFIGYDTGGHMLVGHMDQSLAEIDAFLKHASSVDGPKQSTQ